MAAVAGTTLVCTAMMKSSCCASALRSQQQLATVLVTNNPSSSIDDTSRRNLVKIREKAEQSSFHGDECITLFDFFNDCFNDLMTDFDNDSRLLTMSDYAIFVNKLSSQTYDNNATSTITTVSDTPTTVILFSEINESMQLIYIEHLCKVYFDKGLLPQFRSGAHELRYETIQACFIDLFQHVSNYSTTTFGYPSDQVAIEDMDELCHDMYEPVIALGYLKSCDQCVTSNSFVQVCSEELVQYAGPGRSVTKTEYVKFVRFLQGTVSQMYHTSSSNDVASSTNNNDKDPEFYDLDEKLQHNFITHICKYQSNPTEDCETMMTSDINAASNISTFGYQSNSDTREDVKNMCSDLFRVVSCLDYITPCFGGALDPDPCGTSI
jgi:hypothetical protein